MTPTPETQTESPSAQDAVPRPCPFCNSSIELHHPKGSGYADITYLLCAGCGLVASFRPNKKGRAAIAAFNRRTAATVSAEREAEVEGLRKENAAMRATLERIGGMSVRFTCACGRPTGTGAIKSCADKALAAAPSTLSAPTIKTKLVARACDVTLPQRKAEPPPDAEFRTDYEIGLDHGWNECLDAIKARTNGDIPPISTDKWKAKGTIDPPPWPRPDDGVGAGEGR